MKKYLLLFFVVSILAGCQSDAYNEYQKENPDAMLGNYGDFKIIDSAKIPTIFDDQYIEIVKDLNTGCEYFADSTNNNPLTLSPVYDKSGEVKGCGEIE